MAQTFLGVGVAFPIAIDAEGTLQLAAYEDSVRQSIEIILGTAKGERIMRPGFGCGIYDLVFEAQTPATAGRIAQTVREDLTRLEPRLDVLEVQATPQSDEEGASMLIHITYQVRATNNAFNLVYPFYLERSSGS